jgi:outer membrane immunogenic protein
MKRFILTACAGLIAAAVASPSFAADLPRPSYKSPVYSPEYVAPFSWTGFYVGLNGGYGWGQSKWSGSAGNFEVSPKGWLAGGTLGYNLQTGAWVWGIEGDIDYVNLKGTADAAFCPSCTFKDTWLGTLRGRIGYSFDRWLPYLTGGLAYGNMYLSTGNGGSVNRTKAGWTAGAGLEYAFVGAWSAKIEYLYVDLGSATCGSAACVLPSDETVNFKASLVRLGVNYRF